MSITKNTKIGEIVVHARGTIVRTSDIVDNGAYGVTCWELGTTNGNLYAVASGIEARLRSVAQMQIELDDPTYRIELKIGDESVDPAGLDTNTLLAKLADMRRSAAAEGPQALN